MNNALNFGIFRYDDIDQRLPDLPRYRSRVQPSTSFELFVEQQLALVHHQYQSAFPEPLEIALGNSEETLWVPAAPDTKLLDHLIYVARVASRIEADRIFVPRIVTPAIDPAQLPDDEQPNLQLLACYAQHNHPDGSRQQLAVLYPIEDLELTTQAIPAPAEPFLPFQGLLPERSQR